MYVVPKKRHLVPKLLTSRYNYGNIFPNWQFVKKMNQMQIDETPRKDDSYEKN